MAKKKRPRDKADQPPETPIEMGNLPDPRLMEGLFSRLLPGLPGKKKRSHSPLDQAQELIYEAFESEDPSHRLELAQKAIALSPDCADAYVLLAEQASSLEEEKSLYQQGMAAGERSLGKPGFQEAAGHFWGVLETRPYMRARLGLAEALWEEGNRDEALGHFREMLRLNPNDNQGVRYLLLRGLLDLNLNDEAAALLDVYADDGSTEWTFGRALLAFRRESDTETSRRLLQEAHQANNYVSDYLLDNRPMPRQSPTSVSPGGEDEAIQYAGGFRSVWRSTPGALGWMRKTLKVAAYVPPPVRRPPWSQLQRKYLNLPQRSGEVWQVDTRQLPETIFLGDEQPGEEDMPRPWLLLITNRTEAQVITAEFGGGRPTPGEIWDYLLDAMREPREGDPHRPERIEVRLKSLATAWRSKLEKIRIACDQCRELDHLDHVFQKVVVSRDFSEAAQQTGEQPEIPGEQLLSLPREIEETWQADIRRLPNWIENEGEMLRPWCSIVTHPGEGLILSQDMTADEPPQDWLWRAVAQAMMHPLAGEPHRPGAIAVASASAQQSLVAPLAAAGIECVVSEPLDQIDEIFQEMGRHLPGGSSVPALIDVPGMSIEQVHGFFDAAAEFYRQAPWRRVPGDSAFRIDCDQYTSGPWYGVVMGQSGMVVGLALYEDLAVLQSILGGDDSDEENFRHTTGLSVMFNEAFEIPVADFDAAERLGWPIAAPEAYPEAVRVNPGHSVRPPLAWELRLLEGCLRALVQFIADKSTEAVLTVPTATGPLSLGLSRVEE